MSDALKLADELEMWTLGEPAAAELRRLHGKVEMWERAYTGWLTKTEWVQDTLNHVELGMHRADVLRQRIERLHGEVESLRAEKAELLAALKRFDDGCVTDDSCGECRWCVAQAAITKAEGA